MITTDTDMAEFEAELAKVRKSLQQTLTDMGVMMILRGDRQAAVQIEQASIHLAASFRALDVSMRWHCERPKKRGRA